jgi:hypothetical protein
MKKKHARCLALATGHVCFLFRIKGMKEKLLNHARQIYGSEEKFRNGNIELRHIHGSVDNIQSLGKFLMEMRTNLRSF